MKAGISLPSNKGGRLFRTTFAYSPGPKNVVRIVQGRDWNARQKVVFCFFFIYRYLSLSSISNSTVVLLGVFADNGGEAHKRSFFLVCCFLFLARMFFWCLLFCFF